jgi:ribose transport system substrate-binding protein
METRHRQSAVLAAAAITALTLSACSGGGTGTAASAGAGSSTKPISVVLSNGFVNGWRQTLIKNFEAAATTLKSDGLVSSYQSVNAPGNNSATEQASQIRSLILKKPDVLIVIPASSTALVPVVNEACAADIKVIILDADMKTNCGHVIRNDYAQWGADSINPALKAINGKGNIVINRGVVGSQPEEAFYNKQLSILKNYPNVKVAATITGMCDASTAQKELASIIASLPEITAVPGCIGGQGVVQAFGSAGRPAPVVVFDTDGKSLKFWKDSKLDNGSFATLTDPGQGVAALYVALKLTAGHKVPDTIVLPMVSIPVADRDIWLKNLSSNEYAAWPWDKASVDAAIISTEKGQAVKAPAIK